MSRLRPMIQILGTTALTVLCLSCSSAGPDAAVNAKKEAAVSVPEEPKAEVQTPQSRVGKAPPELASSIWLNTKGAKPPSWPELKGKVVLLDLWAFW